MVSIEEQYNLNMRQAPAFGLANHSRNMPPYKMDGLWNLKKPSTLSMNPANTNSLSKNPLPYTNTRSLSSANTSSRSLMNHAMAPYGNGRGQLSLITQINKNKPQPLLNMNNEQAFKTRAFKSKQVHVPQHVE